MLVLFRSPPPRPPLMDSRLCVLAGKSGPSRSTAQKRRVRVSASTVWQEASRRIELAREGRVVAQAVSRRPVCNREGPGSIPSQSV